jgi:hypothetical protein
VTGRKRSCTGFLLKCKRRLVSEGRSDEAPIKAECVGMVTSIVEFSELCDFQALHPGLQKQKNPNLVSRDSYEIARLLNGKDLTSSAPLFLPPMSFSKFSVPMKSSVYGPCASTGDQPYKKFSYASHAVGFDLSKAVPEHGIAEPVPSDHPHMVTLAKVRTLPSSGGCPALLWWVPCPLLASTIPSLGEYHALLWYAPHSPLMSTMPSSGMCPTLLWCVPRPPGEHHTLLW